MIAYGPAGLGEVHGWPETGRIWAVVGRNVKMRVGTFTSRNRRPGAKPVALAGRILAVSPTLDVEQALAVEAKARQAHGQTAPGKTLVQRIEQAFETGRAADQAAQIVGTNHQYVVEAKARLGHNQHTSSVQRFEQSETGRAANQAAQIVGTDDSGLVAFVVSLNLKRRHLSSSQRAVVALDVEKALAVEAKARQRLSEGRGQKGVQIFEHLFTGRAADQAAQIVGTDDSGLVAFVVSLNLKRRHLSSSQRAVVALDVERELAVEAKEKEQDRKTTFQKFEKSNIDPIHAASQAAQIVGTNRHAGIGD